MAFKRRDFIKTAGASAALGMLAGCASMAGSGKTAGRVVVIGGGYAGATAAKYIRMWSPDIEVVLVERQAEFISCPVSNLVIGGSRTLADITRGYAALVSNYGIRLIHDEALAIDPVAKAVQLASGDHVHYDRLIVAPGIDFMYDQIPGLNTAAAQEKVLHAWKAGAQTVALRKQLEAMPDGGVYAIHIPKAPYRCPPGPYERACQVAFYLKQAKPKSKVLVLDANEDIVSKKGLFTKAWKELYPGMIEYRPNSELQDVDARTLTAKLMFEDIKADVLNVVPPQQAGKIAQAAGLITANQRWCEIDWLTYESKAHNNIHVLGDALLAAPFMPKSGHMANGHGKACAAAVVALMHNEPVNPAPTLSNTCYSYVSDQLAVHVASIHKYDPAQRTMVTAQGSFGVSAAINQDEAAYAAAWAQNIWADSLS